MVRIDPDEINRADAHLPIDGESSGKLRKPRDKFEERLLRLMAEFPQARILHAPIDEKIGAHAALHRKDGEIGHGLVRPFWKNRKRRKRKRQITVRLHIETDADRVAGTEHLALDLKHVTQARIQSGGQDYQPGFDLITRGKCDVLPCRIAGNRRDFRCGMVDVIRDLLSHRIHQIMIHDASPAAGLAVNQPAITHHPDLPIDASMRHYIISKSRKTEQRQLGLIKFLAAEFRPLFHVRIDEHRIMPGPAEHGRGGGAGKPAADNGHICCQAFHAAAFPDLI